MDPSSIVTSSITGHSGKDIPFPLINAALFNFVFSANALSPIVSTVAGTVIDVIPVLENACIPIVFTLAGMIISSRLVQSANALSPIVSTFPGMFIVVSEEHWQNASLFITFSDSGNVISVNSARPRNAAKPISVTGIPSISSGIVISVSSPE